MFWNMINVSPTHFMFSNVSLQIQDVFHNDSCQIHNVLQSILEFLPKFLNVSLPIPNVFCYKTKCFINNSQCSTQNLEIPHCLPTKLNCFTTFHLNSHCCIFYFSSRLSNRTDVKFVQCSNNFILKGNNKSLWLEVQIVCQILRKINFLRIFDFMNFWVLERIVTSD